ncbi:putative ubiquitin-conjugating enzyme E2 25 [Orchesella cincta]|uniref:Putative ubiquitin-conjugating enzyme E2 25 n=1 Tax=Orchesella cincta TaxID=48709 RepID=A0A1D2NM14_ORCCI|nr:putative ubiquitin-conjugating enzyme E2 25 [Orchesella cincta]
MTSKRSDSATRKRSYLSMASGVNEKEDVELDHESAIGSMEPGSNNADGNGNVNEECDIKNVAISQPLLKGDKVLAVGNIGGWQWRRKRKDSKMVTGTVVLGKEQTLSILWEHGKIEKLNSKSDLLSYGDRVFVLDREFITTGSRVVVTGHPDRLVGTVLNKRYIAAASCTVNSDVIFDNVDTKTLSRHPFGGSYNGSKILFDSWIGIIVGSRSRLYLKAIEDGAEFSVIQDGRYPQSFVVGEEIKLGLGMIWNAQNFSTGDSLWLANAIKYYNTSAIVTNVVIEELEVVWIGKATSPKADYYPYEFPDAPDKIIPYESLGDVGYLSGENCYHIFRKNVWKYSSSSNDIPVSRDKWMGKWLKIVDWDRWEYADCEIIADKEKYLNKELALQIECVRSIIDVLWDNGNRSTVGTCDVIPAHVGSAWSEITQLHSGAIVRDRLDFENKDKYGVLLDVDKEMNATVKWITPSGKEGGFTEMLSSNVPLYNLVEKEEYEFISRISQCPLVHSKGRFQIGVVIGIKSSTGEVEVRLPDGKLEYRMPHQLTHYKCDVLYCPRAKEWVSWYEHILPPSGIISVTPSSESDAQELSSWDECLSVPIMKRLDFTDNVPTDNIFACEDTVPRVRETQFRRAVEKEVAEMGEDGQCGLPEGIWVEYYLNRGDIMSAVVAGPVDTVFEDFLFIFDIFLLEDFPRSEPHINFRSMGVTLFPRHFCKSGAVFLPDTTRLTDEDFTLSYIQNLLLEIKDFMARPLDQIRKLDNKELGPIKHENVEELHKFLSLSVLDYTIAILRTPPQHWNSLIGHHFSEALPRIIERYTKAPMQLKRPTASVNNEKGDVPEPVEFQLVTVHGVIPTVKVFRQGWIHYRIFMHLGRAAERLQLK